MDREILFRGKRVDNGEWVDGYYFKNENGTFIFTFPYHANYAGIDVMVKVDPETVCQYTGLTDKNCGKIFDLDVVKHYNDAEHPEIFDIGTILWDKKDCGFYRSSKESDFCNIDRCCVYEIVGNVFDNPELSEGGQNESNTGDGDAGELYGM